MYAPIEYVEEYTRELLFNMLVQNPRYLVEFLGYTIYSIPTKRTDQLKLGIVIELMPSILQKELNRKKLE